MAGASRPLLGARAGGPGDARAGPRGGGPCRPHPGAGVPPGAWRGRRPRHRRTERTRVPARGRVATRCGRPDLRPRGHPRPRTGPRDQTAQANLHGPGGREEPPAAPASGVPVDPVPGPRRVHHPGGCLRAGLPGGSFPARRPARRRRLGEDAAGPGGRRAHARTGLVRGRPRRAPRTPGELGVAHDHPGAAARDRGLRRRPARRCAPPVRLPAQPPRGPHRGDAHVPVGRRWLAPGVVSRPQCRRVSRSQPLPEARRLPPPPRTHLRRADLLEGSAPSAGARRDVDDAGSRPAGLAGRRRGGRGPGRPADDPRAVVRGSDEPRTRLLGACL